MSKGIHLLYKRIGETPLETILRFKKDSEKYKNTPITYAGRLDPMAEGLLLVLSGEEVKKKEKYLDLPKTYEFQILWGFETDTLDILGQIMSRSEDVPTVEKVKKFIKESRGKFEQIYPNFSSKPVLGKPLYKWAREGRLDRIKIPKHVVEVFITRFVSRKFISGKELLLDIKSRIALVSGDFRQKEVIKRWEKELVFSSKEKLVLDKIKIKVSSGFYVRQFVNDLAKELETEAVAFHIKRTNIGGYKL